MSSGAASRRKGRTGEAELRSIFHTAGATVHAGQRNLVGECDLLVTIRGSSERLHVECKRQERLRLPEWLAQAAKDASPDAAPVGSKFRKKIRTISPKPIVRISRYTPRMRSAGNPTPTPAIPASSAATATAAANGAPYHVVSTAEA